MANYDKEIYELGQVYDALGATITEENQQSLGKWFAIGSGYYHRYFQEAKKINEYYAKNNERLEKINEQNKKINEQTKKINETQALWTVHLTEDKAVDANNFHQSLSKVEILEIINFYNWRSSLPEEKEPEREKEQKEDSTVPATLETMVASYKDSQTDKLEADTTHTVADAVKRARKTWEARNRTETILKNRTEKQIEAEDDYFVKNVDPKSESRQDIYRNVESVARQAVIAQAANLGIGLTPAQIKQATNDLTYLGLTGQVDLTNFRDLNIVSQLTFRNLEGVTFTSPLNDIDHVVQAWQHENEIAPYTEKPDELAKQIEVIDEKSQQYFATSTKNFQFRLNKNLDLDNEMTAAVIEAHNVQTALLKVAPNAEHPREATPLELHGKELEVLLRKADPTLLINGEGLEERTAAVLLVTKSGNRNISPEALKLFGIGLDTAGLDKAVANNPALKAFFETEQGKSVYQQVHFQLTKIQNSKLGREIAGNIKPLSGISGSLTNFYNRNPALQSATKLILDPGGTVRSWVNKRIGTHIGNELLKRTGSALSQKLGNFILKEGLGQGIKKFASEAAKKIALEAAKKIGVAVVGDSLVATVAAALGVPTMGVSLIIGAIIIVAQVVIDTTIGLAKKGLDNVWRELGWGDKFRSRDLILPVAAGGAVALTAGIAFVRGLIIIRRSVQVAAVSALGIIIGAIAVIVVYIGIAFLIAPILSTLVQFDSLERVDYGLPSFPGIINPPITDCTEPYEPLSFPNTTSNSTANKAWEIVNKLERGFWCYWNNSPDYPELFNEEKFASDPNPEYPGWVSGCGDCLFWCTHLVNKSYDANMSLNAQGMADEFKSQNKYLTRDTAKYTNILPGAAVFFYVEGGPNRINHVGIVYSVSEDAIVFVQSNSSTKYGTITVGLDGIPQNLPYAEVSGFGGILNK
ncbi:MAG: hypothetical protein ACD_61C00042G0002 [uncultured bacterium]|nr:MAG: hypothetical protein ACD_61C00042G0002 [uncultured bacterium]